MSLYDDAGKIKSLRSQILTDYAIRDTEYVGDDPDDDDANEEFMQALAFLELAGCAMTKAAMKQSRARNNFAERNR